ncbi:hypothetical protein [Chitinophaga barathri]|uniref:hypothetical protein n=1 Tax=Chitinophaga barathri TaxID=1647451 RepID=UPI000EA368A5|nr:hypothetical protein [Chitinophaga barathri]
MLLLSISCAYAQQNTDPYPITGNLGLGTGTGKPTAAALEIAGGPSWTTATWRKSIRLRAGGAVRFINGGTSYFGIGSTTPDGLYFFSSTGDTSTSPISYRMALLANGNVGIGTITPTAQLDVHGNFRLGIGAGTGGTAYCIGFTRIGNPHLFGTTGEGLTLGGDVTGKDMVVLPNGNVGIGTVSPQAKLAVNGTVYARKIKVTQTAADWPDYVFAKDYKLPALYDVETFVNRHQHLPEMPSAAEVEKDGADLGEMNKKLLKKVEELTLYVIEMNKKHEALTEEVRQMKKQIKK